MAQTDPQTTEALDKLFNAWLTTNDMLCKDGVLYQTNDKGEILKTKEGNPKTVIPQEFNRLIADPIKGLELFAQKQGINIKPLETEFPQQ